MTGHLLLSPRFESALLFAVNAHRNHNRKCKHTPYAAHLLAVCALVIEAGATENTIIAALLHDAVEDQGGTSMLNMIEISFGAEVAELVSCCTDSFSVPKAPWKIRKTSFLEKLQHVPSAALQIIIADKLHNIRCLISDYEQFGERTWSHFNGQRQGILWYYNKIADFFRLQPDSAIINEYLFSVDRLNDLTQNLEE